MIVNWRKILLICLLIASTNSRALAAEFIGNSQTLLGAPVFLPVDEAFRLSVDKTKDGIKLYWQISPGYYLYKHRLKVTATKELGDLSLSPGIEKSDEYFGEVEVYYDQLDIDVALKNESASLNDSIELTVEYQGCAEAGICYPPQKKRLSP